MIEKFAHEKLDCYRLAVDFARWAAWQTFPRHRSHLRDQLVRAADSIVLNIAEGSGHPPGNQRRNHHRIAKGSAAECCSVLDLVVLPDSAEQQDRLRRIGAMLGRMSRR